VAGNGTAQLREFIDLPPPDIRVSTLRLVGDTPLISHRWSEKAKKEMLDKQMKRAKVAKAAKDPERDYLESLYPHPDGGYGFPAIGFKNAAVTAVTQVSGLTKVLARGAFHVISDGRMADGTELIKIEGEPTMREDMVRIAMGTADIRYRGQFNEWSCVLRVRYNAGVIGGEMMANLFQHAGFSVGIGEWRPEKDGNFGMFHVELAK
jgi:hypothetical protein